MKSIKFTLVELLLVIAIIAILASMLLPALNKARDKAKSINCVSNLKQVGTFNIAYAEDYAGNMPEYYDNAIPTPRTWSAKLMFLKYVTKGNVLLCPSISPFEYTNSAYRTYGQKYSSAGTTKDFRILDTKRFIINDGTKNYYRSPSAAIMYADCITYQSSKLVQWYYFNPFVASLATEGNALAYAAHQSDMVNSVFVDGHAASANIPILSNAGLWTICNKNYAIKSIPFHAFD